MDCQETINSLNNYIYLLKQEIRDLKEKILNLEEENKKLKENFLY